MGFDGERFRSKGWPAAQVRHRIETLLGHPSTGDVNPVLGHEFFVAAQVDGWHRIFRSVPPPSPRRREHAEGMPQQMPRPADPAFAQKLAHLAAGARVPAYFHLRRDLDLES